MKWFNQSVSQEINWKVWIPFSCFRDGQCNVFLKNCPYILVTKVNRILKDSWACYIYFRTYFLSIFCQIVCFAEYFVRYMTEFELVLEPEIAAPHQHHYHITTIINVPGSVWVITTNTAHVNNNDAGPGHVITMLPQHLHTWYIYNHTSQFVLQTTIQYSCAQVN